VATEAQIYASFSGPWLSRGNDYFVPKESAQAFARYLTDTSVRILAIDGFILEADATMPILDVMSDYSSQVASPVEIQNFLSAGQDFVSHYNFVLEAQ
jgi:hypothetical protein